MQKTYINNSIYEEDKAIIHKNESTTVMSFIYLEETRYGDHHFFKEFIVELCC
jgi:hypothetical protein